MVCYDGKTVAAMNVIVPKVIWNLLEFLAKKKKKTY